MSGMRTITGLWKKHEETSENPTLPGLKTQYYRASREALIKHIHTIAGSQKLSGWKIINEDVDRGEVVLEKKQGAARYSMVVTVFKLTPMRSAIDIYCAKEGTIGDFGNSYRYILEFFKALHQEVQPEK